MSKNEYDIFEQPGEALTKPTKKEIKKKKWIRCKDGIDMYSMSRPKLVKLAREAGAAYKIDGVILINADKMDRYLESFRIPGEIF